MLFVMLHPASFHHVISGEKLQHSVSKGNDQGATFGSNKQCAVSKALSPVKFKKGTPE